MSEELDVTEVQATPYYDPEQKICTNDIIPISINIEQRITARMDAA